MGIEVLPPDVNESVGKFTVVEDKIRFGLEGVKNVGENAIKSVISAGEKHGKFTSFFQFCERVDLRVVNKKALESLILAGAFDSINSHRAQLLASVDQGIQYGQAVQRDKKMGQTSLFDTLSGSKVSQKEPELPDVPRWHLSEILSKEKKILGLYVSGHPLTKYEEELKSFTTCTTESLENLSDNQELFCGGIITNVKTTVDKKGKLMAFFTLEDFVGQVEVLVFSDCYKNKNSLIKPDQMVLVKGKTSTKESEKPKIIAKDIIPLNLTYEKLRGFLHLTLEKSSCGNSLFSELKTTLSSYPGKSDVILHIKTEDENLKMRVKNIRVQLSKEFLKKLKEILGNENVYIRMNI